MYATCPLVVSELKRCIYVVDTPLIHSGYVVERSLVLNFRIPHPVFFRRNEKAYFPNTSQAIDKYLVARFHNHHLGLANI